MRRAQFPGLVPSACGSFDKEPETGLLRNVPPGVCVRPGFRQKFLELTAFGSQVLFLQKASPVT